jgi:DNA-binding response OmpR family regulator
MLLTVGSLPDTGVLYADELEIRLGEGLVLASGRALTLSVREFELLVAMAQRMGDVITREELYDSEWGGELRPGDRSVDVYVSKLRGKLEAAMPDHRFIHTHPGFGYRFQPQPVREQAGGRGGSRSSGSKASARSDAKSLSRDLYIGTSGA